MKIYLLIILMVLFIFVGILVYFKYYYRFVFHKDMVYLCKVFKNNISFNKDSIHKILNSNLNNISSVTKIIIESCCFNKKNFFINKYDFSLLSKFFESLGNGDIVFEINNLDYYQMEFNERQNLSKELLDKEGKMYLKLIIGIGLIVCIILI